MSRQKKTVNFSVHMERFEQYETPNGFLTHEPACHALWFYYTRARLNYEKMIRGIVLEGDPDPRFDFKQLFRTTAVLYGVSPEKMSKFWTNVDAQCAIMNLPLLPKEEKFRFNTAAELRSDA